MLKKSSPLKQNVLVDNPDTADVWEGEKGTSEHKDWLKKKLEEDSKKKVALNFNLSPKESVTDNILKGINPSTKNVVQLNKDQSQNIVEDAKENENVTQDEFENIVEEDESKTIGGVSWDEVAQKEGIVDEEEETDKQKELKEINAKKSKETKALNKELNAMFLDPQMKLNHILKDKKTLQNLELSGEHPEQYLKKYMHANLGGFGLLSGDIRSKYNSLNNEEINNAIDGVFNLKLEEEKKDQFNIHSAKTIQDYNLFGKHHKNYYDWQNNYRKTDIKTFTGDNLLIANSWEKIMQGNLSEQDRLKEYTNFEALKKKTNKPNYLIDLRTGRQILAADDEEGRALREAEGERNVVEMDIYGKQEEYQGYEYAQLKDEYERSALALTSLNNDLDEVGEYQVTTRGFSGLGLDVGGKKMTVKKSFRDMVEAHSMDYKDILPIEEARRKKGESEQVYKARIEKAKEDWAQKIQRYQADMVDYNEDHEALRRMLLLNEGVLDDDQKAGSLFLDRAAESFAPWFFSGSKLGAAKFAQANLRGEWASLKDDNWKAVRTGASKPKHTDIDIRRKKGDLYSEMGWRLNEEEDKYIEGKGWETVAETAGGSARFLTELFALGGGGQILKGGKYIRTGFGSGAMDIIGGQALMLKNSQKWLSFLNSSKYMYAGRVLSKPRITARAVDYSTKMGTGLTGSKALNAYVKANNIKVVPSFFNKAGGIVGAMGMEGIKMGIVHERVAGDKQGYVIGAAFGGMGKIMQPAARLFESWSPLSSTLYQKFLYTPASFATSVEVADNFSALVNHARGSEEYSTFINGHYGKYNDIEKRVIENGIFGWAMGMGSFKGFADLKTYNGLKSTKRKAWGLAQGQVNLAIQTAKGKGLNLEKVIKDNGFWSKKSQQAITENLGDKGLAEYNKHLEVHSNMTGRIQQVQRAQGYLNPLTADKKVANDFDPYIKQAKEQGITLEVDVVHNDKLKFGEKPMGNNAEWKIDPKNPNKRKIRVNAEKYSPGIAPHELGHEFTFRNFTENARFKGDFLGKLNKIAEQIEIESFNPKTGRNFTLAEAMKEEGYDAGHEINNQRIKEWELFSYIKENLADKANYNKLKDSNAYARLGGWIRSIGKEAGHKYDLTKEKDVVRWFNDYLESVGKGKAGKTEELMGELDKVIDWQETGHTTTAMEVVDSKTGRSLGSGDLKVARTKLQNQKTILMAGSDKEREENKGKIQKINKKIDAINKNVKHSDVNKKAVETIEDVKTRVDFDGIYEKYKEKIDPVSVREEFVDGKFIEKSDKYTYDRAIADEIISLRNEIKAMPKKSGKAFEAKAQRVKDMETWSRQRGILIENNMGTIGNWKKRKFDAKGDVDYVEFESSLNEQLTKILNSYKDPNVPFGYYLRSRLEPQLGNILRRAQKGSQPFQQSLDVLREAGFDVADVKGVELEITPTEKKKKGIRPQIIAADALKLDKSIVKEVSAEGLDPTDALLGYKKAGEQYRGTGLEKHIIVDKFGVSEAMFEKMQKSAAQNLAIPDSKAINEYIAKETSTIIETAFPETVVPEKTFVREGELVGEYKPPKKLVGKAMGVQTKLEHEPLLYTLKDGVYVRSKRLNEYTLNKNKAFEISEEIKGTERARKKLAKEGLDIANNLDVYTRAGERVDKLQTNLNKVNKSIEQFETDFKKIFEIKKDRSHSQKQKALMNQVVRATAVQQVKKAPSLKDIADQVSAGKPPALYSKTLGVQKSKDQRRFFAEIQTPEFREILDANVKDKSIKNPIEQSFKEYFKEYRGYEFGVSMKDLDKIGKELKTKLDIEGLTQVRLATRIGKTIFLPNERSAIEMKHGYERVEDTFASKDYMRKAQYTDALLAEKLEAEFGKGVYEATFLDGTTGPGGYGKWRTIEAMEAGLPTEINRTSVWRDVSHVNEMLGNLPKTNKIYQGIERGPSNRPGVKANVFADIGFKPGAKSFNEAGRQKLYENAEFNKKVLKRAVEILNDLHMNEATTGVTYKHVRTFADIHSGSMKGLIKKSASLAILPKGSPKELMKLWGTDMKKWVLEHITPAKDVANRIYDYILEKDPAIKKSLKKALDLTLKDYHTTLIPKSKDQAVNVLYKSELPPDHTPGLDPMDYRYYMNANISDFGMAFQKFNAKGKVIKEYSTGTTETYAEMQARGEALRRYNNAIFPEGIKKGAESRLNSKQLDAANTYDKAIKEGRKKDKKSRGMSTWDLDGTLIHSKSGVKARIPNIDGKPKPKRKVVFLAGGAGSGKSNVIKKLELEKQGFKIVNQDISLEWLKKNHGLPENMNELTKEQRSTLGKLQHQARQIAKDKMMKYKGDADGVVVDGTGGSIKAMEKLVNEFKDKGYDASMLFVETSLETALKRNKAREERSLLDKMVEKNHAAVQGNKPGFRTMFGERFMEVKTDKLKQEDVMPEDLVAKMDNFVSGYEKIRLDAEQFAIQGKEILDRGGKFDFSEFNTIKEGEPGPFFQKALNRAKKYGTKDQFILTARPPEAVPHIQEFLKSLGLNIPLKNITGLGNSTGEAKAMWMLKKFSEGYNDMYFADDVVQNVKEVKHVLDQLDIKSKVVQVQDVNKLDSPGTYEGVLASRKLRLEYEKTITKHRPDLVKEGLVSRTIDDMFDFIDALNVPANKKKKYEQVTTKWLATSNVKLKEDAYKIKQAVEIAEKYKEDIFSYRNPNELIEKYAGKVKEKPLDPSKVKEFTFSGEHKKRGITVYEVQNTKEGQQAVRDIVNTHWGIDSNPWCITKAKKGKLTEDAWLDWTAYEKGPKRIIFQDGKLSSFHANRQYWDRMDNATDGPTISIKEGRVTKKVELVPDGTGRVEEFIRETRTVSKDKKTVTKEIFAESQDGYAEGTKIVENRVNGKTVKSTRYNPKGGIVEIKDFNKDGKATASYNFFPDGKMSAVNTYGQPFGDMTTNNVVRQKGDILSHQHSEGGIAYMYGRIKLNDKATEIGWKVAEKNSDLKNVIKTVDGKVRLDLKKVLEIDADARTTLPGKTPVKLSEVLKPQVREGMQSLEPVKKILDQLDVKSNVQQALASKNLDVEFNQIIEDVKGISKEKEFKSVTAKMMGAKKGKYKWVIPPSAADFELLTSYTFAGKGKRGEAHQEWWNENLFKPFARGINDINTAKQTTANDYLALRKLMPGARKMLKKKVAGTGFTHDAAIRVHRWTESGFEVPGISKKDLKLLNDVVNNNPELKAFSDGLGKISKTKEGWVEPTEHWLTENITADLHAVTTRVGRKQYLAEWIENKNIVFSKKNMNKIEAVYGKNHREALEDMLYRMEHGTNRTTGRNALTNKFMNWTNNSVGAVMFFNMRSAGLQLLSSVNYINHAENNIFKAGKAFANQPQYWKDFATIYNSDMLKQRRAGLKMNVNEAEIAAAVEGSSNKAQAALSWLLKKGFTPTQLADSFAIASGGATYLRNRIKMYEKQGLETKEAEKKAWTDFQEIAEKTQQSARPDLISQQQASPLGRLILAFANTPMQYARIMKKGAMDLASGRGDPKAHISRILYYGGIQGMIFASLQSGMFSMLFDDELGEDYIDKKQERVLNTMTDGLLRGTGVAGASVSAIKNGVIRFMNENEKGYNQDYMNVVVDMLNVSPTIGSKVRKLKSAGDGYKWNKDVIGEMGMDIENPGLYAAANVVSATTNVPLDRLVTKVNNLKGAIDAENETWQRIALFMGYNRWDLGMDKPKAVIEAKKVVKEKKKVIAKAKRKVKQEEEKKIELQEKKKEGEKKQEQEKKEGKQITCLICKLPIAEGKKYCTIHEKVEQNETGEKTQCKKIKSNDKQCKMKTSSKSGYCYYHD
jgi:predicted kinase